MIGKGRLKKSLKIFLVFILTTSWLFSGWPQIWYNPLFPPEIQEVQAAVPTVTGFQASNGGTSASSSLALTAPSGITAGELLLLIVGNEDSSNTDQFSNNLSGWNFIDDGGDSNADAHIGAFWRVATGSESNVTVTAQSSDYWFGWYIRISGVDTSDPIGASNFTQSSANSNSHVIPEITTDQNNNLVIYGLSFDGGDGYPFSVSGTGWSEEDEQQNNTSGSYVAGVWGTKNQTSAGATVDVTVGCNASDGAAYFQLAIQSLQNEPPAAPTLSNVPFDNEKTGDSTPDFKFTADDPDGSSDITYQIQIDDSYDFGSLVVNCESNTSCATGDGGFTRSGDSDPFTEGQEVTFTPVTELSNNATYYWRVRAKDVSGSGSYGEWSAIPSVTYVSGIDPSDWFQTTDEQFDTGTPAGTQTSGSDSVELGGGEIAKTGSDTSHTDSGAISSTSFSHTLVSGSSRMVAVSVGLENDGDNDISNVSYGGTSMTKAIDEATGTSGYIMTTDIWYILESSLTAMGDGSKTVEITLSTTGSTDLEINALAAEYTNVSQGAPEATDPTIWSSGSSISNDISPSSGAWVISVWGIGNTGNVSSSDNDQVEVLDFTDTSSNVAVLELRGATGEETSLSSTFSASINRGVRCAASWTGAGGSSGSIMSPAIDYDWLSGASNWGQVTWGEDETGGGTVSMQVYRKGTEDCDTLVSDSLIPNNSTGIASGPISLTALDELDTTHNRLCLKATLNKGTSTPYLNDWTVSWSSGAVVSVTITTDGTVTYGIVPTSSNKSTIDLSDTQTAQNDGNVTETFNIKTSNATGGTSWSLGSTPGTNVFVHEFSINSGSNWTKFNTADEYQQLATGITPEDTQDFDLRITVPSESSDYQEKTITITIQAVQ